MYNDIKYHHYYYCLPDLIEIQGFMRYALSFSGRARSFYIQVNYLYLVPYYSQIYARLVIRALVVPATVVITASCIRLLMMMTMIIIIIR